MLRYSEEKLNTESAISALYPTVRRELDNRKELYNMVRRKINDSDIASLTDEEIKIPLERYISVVATGYFGGKEPKYKVKAFDEDSSKLNKDLFESNLNDEKALKEIEQIIAHITDYNDDKAHHLSMVWDFFTKRACYELYYKNQYGEYVYTRSDALETVAIYDYSMPKNLIGLYRVIDTILADGSTQVMVELTTKTGKFYYLETEEKKKLFSNRDEEKITFKKDKKLTQKPKWGDDVPFTAIEQEDNLNIFELVISLIRGLERIVQNNRNIHEYNDDAILAITGYSPQNEMIILDTEGREIVNPKRVLEDEYVLRSKVRYLDQDGKIEWITKNINDSAVENHRKTLMDLICLCSFVPNMTDLGFTQSDNSSALEKKFFNLQQLIATFEGEFKKAYIRRWEVLLNKINKDKRKKYDFRDVDVILYANLPTDKAGETSRALSLREVLSNESIINMLPDDLDAKNEIAKKKAEAETNLEDNQKLMQKFSQNSSNTDNKLGVTPGELAKGSEEEKQEDKPSVIQDFDKLKK